MCVKIRYMARYNNVQCPGHVISYSFLHDNDKITTPTGIA